MTCSMKGKGVLMIFCFLSHHQFGGQCIYIARRSKALILIKPLYLLTRKGKLEANRLLQIFLMDYRDLMAWMTDLAMRISSGEPAKNVREAEALLELHTERKVPYKE